MKKYICLFIMSLLFIVNCSDTLVPPAYYNDTEYILNILDLETLADIDTFDIDNNYGNMKFKGGNKKLHYYFSNYFHYYHDNEFIFDLETGQTIKYDTTSSLFPEDSIWIYRDYPYYIVFNRITGKTTQLLKSESWKEVLCFSKYTSTIYYSHKDSLFSIKTDISNHKLLGILPDNQSITFGKMFYKNKQENTLLCVAVDDHEYFIYKYTFNNGKLEKLFSTLIPNYDQYAINLELSPDSENLLFKGYCGDNFELFSIPLNGGKKTRVTHTEQHETKAQYLPDGRIIFLAGENEDFSSYWVNDSQLDMYIMNADGSNRQKIAENVSTNYAISEDGTRLAYIEQKVQDINNDD